jgi:hypothetical protein
VSFTRKRTCRSSAETLREILHALPGVPIKLPDERNQRRVDRVDTMFVDQFFQNRFDPADIAIEEIIIHHVPPPLKSKVACLSRRIARAVAS